MFLTDNNTIRATRGESGSFILTIQNYTFQVDDKITLNVYEEKKLDETPKLSKNITIETETNMLEIDFTETELTLGEVYNEPVEYWYEIRLNDKTVLGYDEDGAKKFIIYPKGVDEVNESSDSDVDDTSGEI